MSQLTEECLLQAIKKDDIKAFNALMEKARYGAFRLGRFPVLSLMYLYNSRKILSVYEQKFLRYMDYEPIREPVEISKKFSRKAGKCLRLYFNEIVSPPEMLLLLDKTKRLKRIFPTIKPSTAVKERLKTIYSIKYSLNVKYEGANIIIDRRPLSYREKKNIATVCLCAVLGVTLTVGVPVTADALIPKPVEGEVTALGQIAFDSQKEYTLKRDIVVPENYSVEKVNCKIYGEGHRLIFGKGASFGELNGVVSDLTIESTGSAIFKTVSESATVENVIINVSVDMTVTAGSAFVAQTNYGTIDGVTVNVSGKLNALAASTEVNAEFSCGGIVQNNSYKINTATQTIYRGIINDCTVNYSRFSLVGEANADAAFGGVAGVNSGYLQDCTVTGEISSDTFDIAGMCVVNNWLLAYNLNEADLLQTSSDIGWNPITCGIVINNAYAVENCKNRGRISAVSECGQAVEEVNSATATAVGIAYLNSSSNITPYILNSINEGNIECVAEYKNSYAAGICVSSGGAIEKCKNSGAITITAGNGCGMYAGGITALSNGSVYYSVNDGAISAVGSGLAYVGGISAHSRAQFAYCLSSGDITVTAQTVCVGGIFGFSEVAYNYAVYRGNADYCISECKIEITLIDDTPAYVGGVVGCISELGVDYGEYVIYYGGRVNNCYFTGECVSEVLYFGNVVGVCGGNVYESNAYTQNSENYNFEGNFYVENSFGAFGATLGGDGSFVSANDKGATAAATEDIKNSEGYYELYELILSALEN